MDQAILSGPTIAVIGIGTVFVALSILVAVISVTARFLARRDAPAAPHAAPAGATVATRTTEDSTPDRDRLLSVALAAYAFHLDKRVIVRAHVASSPWLRAGRQAQVDRIASRG